MGVGVPRAFTNTKIMRVFAQFSEFHKTKIGRGFSLELNADSLSELCITPHHACVLGFLVHY